MNTNKFDVICNTVDNGIILINKNLEVKFWNRWLEIRTGIGAKDIINQNLKDFFTDTARCEANIKAKCPKCKKTFETKQTGLLSFLI